MSFPKYSPSYCSDCGSELGSKRRDGENRLFCKECNQIVWLSPSICAGFLVKRGKEILLQKRKIE
ncbi:MAG: hypothetical protein V5A72_00300, partial [Candidatus Nanohaloarchaea archaeon]